MRKIDEGSPHPKKNMNYCQFCASLQLDINTILQKYNFALFHLSTSTLNQFSRLFIIQSKLR